MLSMMLPLSAASSAAAAPAGCAGAAAEAGVGVVGAGFVTPCAARSAGAMTRVAAAAMSVWRGRERVVIDCFIALQVGEGDTPQLMPREALVLPRAVDPVSRLAQAASAGPPSSRLPNKIPARQEPGSRP